MDSAKPDSGAAPFGAIVLNETTLPRLAWLLLCRRFRRHTTAAPILVVGIQPLTRVGAVFLPRLSEALRARGSVRDQKRDRLDLTPFTDINDVYRYTDSYRLSEPWQETYFRLSEADQRLGEYAFAFRHLAGGYVRERLLTLYRLRRLAAEPDLRVHGVGRDFLSLYRFRFHEAPPAHWTTAFEARFPINTLAAMAMAVYTLGWIATRLRPGLSPQGRYFLASDFVEDPRDEMLWHEVADAPDSVLVVFRNNHDAKAWKPKLDAKGWANCRSRDGLFPVRAGLATMATAAKDIFQLWKFGHTLAPSLFFHLVSLPFKRMMFRGLFHRYRPKFFWARDEYNVEHILRSQELRRVGGVTHGISHGFHVVSTVLQQTRYVDYDRYYVFGKKLCERHISSTWPDHMHLVNISGFALTRDQLASLSTPRPRDIACILVPSQGAEASFTVLREMAEAFPGRTIYFNVKPKYLKGFYLEIYGAYIEQYEEFLRTKPANLVEWRTDIPDQSSYDLFFKCGYVVSEPSTMLVEGIQCGLYGWCLDLAPKWKALTMRDLPGLCVEDAATVIANIKGIEDGSYHYPRELWAEDIDQSGKAIWDVLREGFGLQPKESPLPHLTFIKEHTAE